MLPLDAFELIAHAEHTEDRLAALAAELAGRAGFAEEAAWIEAARRRLAEARGESGALLTRVVRLPELASLRASRGRAMQAAVADAVEGVERSVRAAGGERSPVLEALFRNMKLPLVRRFDRGALERFLDELEKRLSSGYVTRMLADEPHARALPAVEELGRTIGSYRAIFTAPALEDEEAEGLRRELEAVARRVELPLRRARLLAEAALLSDPELLASSGIVDKPRRRAPRAGTGPKHETAPPRSTPGAAEE